MFCGFISVFFLKRLPSAAVENKIDGGKSEPNNTAAIKNKISKLKYTELLLKPRGLAVLVTNSFSVHNIDNSDRGLYWCYFKILAPYSSCKNCLLINCLACFPEVRPGSLLTDFLGIFLVMSVTSLIHTFFPCYKSKKKCQNLVFILVLRTIFFEGNLSS